MVGKKPAGVAPKPGIFLKLRGNAAVGKALCKLFERVFTKLGYVGNVKLQVNGSTQTLNAKMLAADGKTADKHVRDNPNMYITTSQFLDIFYDGTVLYKVATYAAEKLKVLKQMQQFEQRLSGNPQSPESRLRPAYWFILHHCVSRLPPQLIADFNADCIVFGNGAFADANVIVLNLLALGVALGDKECASLMLGSELTKQQQQMKDWQPLAGLW